MTTINDPNGTPARVNSSGRLHTYAVVESEALRACEDGDAYSIVFEADPGGTDVDFFYLRNLDDKDMIVYKIRMSTDSLDIDVDIKVGVTGAPAGGSELTPANMNSGSGGEADVSCEYRDGDLALVGGAVIDTLYIDSARANDPQVFTYPSGILLQKNQALVFNCVGVDPTADINCVAFFYFHEED